MFTGSKTSGRLVGLDASAAWIAWARRRAQAIHAAPVPVTCEIGEVQELPFPDATFDACRAARLLDGALALGGMVRVTRPGGRIVVVDFDWDTLIIDHPDKERTRTFIQSHADAIRN